MAAEPKESPYAGLLTGLRSLGMADVNEERVESLVLSLFPGGTNGHDLGEVIRSVFLELKKQ